MTDNQKEAEDITKFEELKEGWVNDEIDTLTYVAVLHNRIETLERQLFEARAEVDRWKKFFPNHAAVKETGRKEAAREILTDLKKCFFAVDFETVRTNIKHKFKLEG